MVPLVPEIRERTVVAIPAALEPRGRPDVVDVAEARTFVAEALRLLEHTPVPLDVSPDLLQDRRRLDALLRSTGAGFVFNLFEGFGDDSAAEAAFCSAVEASGIPYTGNPPHILELCRSKRDTARLLRNAGLPVPNGTALFPGWDRSALSGMEYPLFVKPLCEDGSVGVHPSSLVRNAEELDMTVARMLDLFPEGVFVEPFLPGREYSVSCIGNGPYRAVGVSVIDYDAWEAPIPFLDYASKWNPASPLYPLVPAPAGAEDEARVSALALRAGEAIGCRGCFRVDLREKDGTLFILDVNPNPDMTPGGGFMRQCREGGIPGERVVALLLEMAFEEHERRNGPWRAS